MTITATTQLGQLIAQRYKIERVLGQGGMGQVFLAQDTVLNQKVALKVLLPELAKNELNAKRFIREVQLTREINDPNVVRTFDVGRDKELLFLTMEYVEGQTLKDLIANKRLSVSESIKILSEIAKGLTAVHKNSIVHRDLKPGNIILDSLGRAKISDFGVARPDNSDLTGHDEIIGCAPYIAPEIWTGDTITAQSDLYALGVMAYEILLGELPFDGNSPAEIMRKHLYAKAPAIKEIDSSIPKWLSNLVSALLEKNPKKRLPDAIEICERIEYGLAHGRDLHDVTLENPEELAEEVKSELLEMLNENQLELENDLKNKSLAYNLNSASNTPSLNSPELLKREAVKLGRVSTFKRSAIALEINEPTQIGQLAGSKQVREKRQRFLSAIHNIFFRSLLTTAQTLGLVLLTWAISLALNNSYLFQLLESSLKSESITDVLLPAVLLGILFCFACAIPHALSANLILFPAHPKNIFSVLKRAAYLISSFLSLFFIFDIIRYSLSATAISATQIIFQSLSSSVERILHLILLDPFAVTVQKFTDGYSNPVLSKVSDIIDSTILYYLLIACLIACTPMILRGSVNLNIKLFCILSSFTFSLLFWLESQHASYFMSILRLKTLYKVSLQFGVKDIEFNNLELSLSLINWGALLLCLLLSTERSQQKAPKGSRY